MFQAGRQQRIREIRAENRPLDQNQARRYYIRGRNRVEIQPPGSCGAIYRSVLAPVFHYVGVLHRTPKPGARYQRGNKSGGIQNIRGRYTQRKIAIMLDVRRYKQKGVVLKVERRESFHGPFPRHTVLLRDER